MNGDVKTKIIKRNGEEVTFDLDKIINAITKANEEVTKIHQMNQYQIMAIAEKVADQVANSSHAVNVEDIQNMVETGIMEMRGYEVAQKYVRYRFKRELRRKSNTTDDGILSLLDNINEEVNQENSNKNPVINSTQRDYMAGEVSKDLSKRVLLPNEIIRAHEEGIIHFHDSDYFAQREHNCDLINLEDMLQNGTVISETLIEKPHSFFTACNVTTQIVAQVASNQYGGQSFTLSHLAPFVDISRKKLRKNVNRAMNLLNDYQQDKYDKVQRKEDLIDKYESRLGDYLIQLTKREMNTAQTRQVSLYLHTINDFERIGDHASYIAHMANEMHDNHTQFSQAAWDELNIVMEAVREEINVTCNAFMNDDREAAQRVAPLGAVITNLCDELKMHHVARLSRGDCGLEEGTVFNDILNSFGRIAAHCASAMMALMKSGEEAPDLHIHDSKVYPTDTVEYYSYFNEYRQKYDIVIDEKNGKHMLSMEPEEVE